MKKIIAMTIKTLSHILLSIILLINTSFAQQISPLKIDGEYRNEDNHGFMTITSPNEHTYNVWLRVGSGSCAGEVMIDNKLLPLTNSHMITDVDINNNICQVEITFSGDSAYVKNSCFSEDDEEDSTCGMLGNYNKLIND